MHFYRLFYCTKKEGKEKQVPAINISKHLIFQLIKLNNSWQTGCDKHGQTDMLNLLTILAHVGNFGSNVLSFSVPIRPENEIWATPGLTLQCPLHLARNVHPHRPVHITQKQEEKLTGRERESRKMEVVKHKNRHVLYHTKHCPCNSCYSPLCDDKQQRDFKQQTHHVLSNSVHVYTL